MRGYVRENGHQLLVLSAPPQQALVGTGATSGSPQVATSYVSHRIESLCVNLITAAALNVSARICR
ncbi:hypothetical protein GCM10023263_92020 [Phytohabitans rumicis]